jgi:hypothetical protein
MAEVKTEEALAALVTALERRTNGMTGRQFENMVSPAMGAAFVQGWTALGRNPDDIPGEWQDMADSFLRL